MLAQISIPLKKYNRIQAVANLLLLAVWYFSNEGLLFWDDFTYLSLANEINQGVFEVSEHTFTNRVALIYPTAWIIKLLGINAYTAVIFPLACSLGVLNLIFWLGRLTHVWVGLTGGLLFVTDYHLGFFSVHLFPELSLTLCVFTFLLSYYLLLKEVMASGMAALVGALALFAALLVKATVFFLVPLLLFLWINDWLKHRNRFFWLVFASLSAFFCICYGLWYQEMKGDFFYRFVNIVDNHVPMPGSLHDKGLIAIIKRLSYSPVFSFFNGGFFIPLGLALPGIFSLKRKDFRLNDADSFWPVASVMLLIGFWLMPTTWEVYSPTPAETRHIVYFIPVFVMTAALYWPYVKLPKVLGGSRTLFAGVFLLFLIPVYRIYQSGRLNFKEEEYLVGKYLVKDPAIALVVTDALTEHGHLYFYGFEEAGDHYVWFSRDDVLDQISVFEGKRYVLLNPAYFNEDYQDTRNYKAFLKKIRESGMKLELLEARGKVKLYRLKE